MPDIDLGPDKYARRDPRTGKMVREISPRRAFWFMVVAIVILGFVFWTRNDGSRESLFGITALFAAVAGVFFANWLRNTY